MSETIQLARNIAAFGSLGESVDPEPAVVSYEGWGELLAYLATQRLTGVATASWEGGSLLLEERQRAELLERQRQAMTRALALERT